jgi:hypothetical protein
MPAISQTPSISDIDRIAALDDATLRNLRITQCYHVLSSVLIERVGPSANWCTFATWASKQAGESIRKEDMLRTFESIFGNDPMIAQAIDGVAACAQELGAKYGAEKIRGTIWEILNPAAAIDRVSDAVGRGNRKVFEEIAREFARFYATCLNDTASDSARIAAFCNELRAGDPPDGQDYLRRAFTAYYTALFEPDADSRAQLLLLANIQIGYHEQTRLQPEIAEALDAAFIDPDEFVNRLIREVFPYGGWLLRARLFFKRLFGSVSPLDAVVGELLDSARRQTRIFITEHVMAIGMPHGVRLRLGQDLTAAFPASLKQLANPELTALLVRIDPTPDSLRDSGALDWADLPDRLHFIADMFRCYQESRDLFDPPFTPDQMAAIEAGRLPEGRL